MLADHHLSDTDLAQLPVHVGNKNFGQPCNILTPLLVFFQPDHDQSEYRGDHVEPAVDTIRDLTFLIPGDLPSFADNCLV